ncbi:MAG: helix-turn-helix transcriptional regulator [Eubacteriales bacterium]
MAIEFSIGERIRIEREKLGLSQEELGAKTGISKSSISNYETKDHDISHVNLLSLAKLFDVSTDYLLGLIGTKKHLSPREYPLDLSDRVIEMIEQKEINWEFLSEMMEHKDFPILLTDMEVYVEGLVSMQVKLLNGTINDAKKQIVKEFNPPKHELYLRTMELAELTEDTHFSHIFLSDLMPILKTMRKHHKYDSSSAPDNDVYVDTKQVIRDKMEEISNSAEEVSKEKQCDILLAAANMDCSVLTEDEEKKFKEYFIKVSEHSVKRFNLKPQAPKQGRKPLPYYNNQQGKGKKK